MIFGIGTDIVSIARMETMWRRYGARMASHMLTAEEQLQLPQDVPRFMAKRFAAKEAFAKAAGTGLRPPVLLGHLSVTHDVYGRPGFAFAPALQAWLDARGVTACHLSISDERDTAVATVVLEAGS